MKMTRVKKSEQQSCERELQRDLENCMRAEVAGSAVREIRSEQPCLHSFIALNQAVCCLVVKCYLWPAPRVNVSRFSTRIVHPAMLLLIMM